MKTYKRIMCVIIVTMLLSFSTVETLGVAAESDTAEITVYFQLPEEEYIPDSKEIYGVTVYRPEEIPIRTELYEVTFDECGFYKMEIPDPKYMTNINIIFNATYGLQVYASVYTVGENPYLLDGLMATDYRRDPVIMEPYYVNGIWVNRETGVLIGDMDKNGELNVKDATYIQKCLAESEDWEDEGEVLSSGLVRYMADFNLDGVRNVKDATELQRYIAVVD